MSNEITRLEIEYPCRVISEANSPEHWRLKHKRKLNQQEETGFEISNALKGRKVRLPCVVTLTRIGSRRLDPDNLANGFKAVQDMVAKKLGCDDGDTEKVQWVYRQEVILKRQYAVRIVIQSNPLPALSLI